MSRITVEQLTVTYRGRKEDTVALEDLSLTLEEGEILGLVGPSGCGKSTLLQVLSGILTDYRGRVLFDGTPPDPRRHSIALVPQGFALLPWKTIRQNILLPQTLGRTRCPGLDHLDEILQTLEIGDLLDRYPAQLSGGQRQRVALARAFVQEPDLLLLDEPFSALDISTAARGRALLRHFREDMSLTTILVSHNLEEIAGLSDRVLVMVGPPGQIVREMRGATASHLAREIKPESKP